MTLTPRFQARRFLLNPVLMLVLFLLAGYGVAQTINDDWINPGTSDWFGANWSLDGVPPSPRETATVVNGGTAQILGPPPDGAPPASALSLTIGQVGLPGGSRVVVDGSQSTLSIGGQISVQNGELDVSNGGTVRLGSLTIGAGGLVSVGTGAASGTLTFTSAAGIQIGAGGNLQFNLTDTTTLSANIAGAGTVTKLGSGTATLSGNNNYTGGTIIQVGTLVGASSTAFGSGPINISTGAVANVAASMQITGNITGPGQVVVTGPSELVLTGNNNYGGLTISPGATVIVGSDSNLGANVTFQSDLSHQVGTLEANASFVTNHLVSLFQGSRILVSNGQTVDFAGTISGAGPLILGSLVFTGTVILSGNNNYAGGTNLEAGTLVGASSTAFGTGPINIAAGATASIRASMQIGASISGQGQVVLIGPATLTLGGNNSYAGGTTVAGGTLVAASNNAFGTGTVTADGSGSSSKIIIGTGLTVPNSFVINNGASLDNSGAINSVASHIGAASIVNRPGGTIGGVVLSGGAANTVQLFSGSAIQGDLNLGNNSGSKLIFDGGGNQLLSQAVTGNITNAGSLTKQGTGTWTVDKALAAPVSVDVVAGKLEVNSTLTSSSVTVQNGATISGSGLITGNLTALGTISPGHSPGTLTLNGNYTQGPSGLLNIVLASPTNFSHLAVGGHAALDGTLQLTLQGGFVPTNGSQFTILTTGKGISGVFRNVVTPQGQALRVSYAQAGIVQLLAGVPKPPELPIAHISDGTPSSTTEMMADLSFFSFSSLAGRMAADTEKANAISIAFDAGEFRYQGHRGEIWGFPISGQRRLTDRMRLDYQIPLQYLDYPGAHLFQSGLILELPTKIILPSENHPWTWDCKPTLMVGASGSKEVIGGGALTNVVTYRWNDVVFTYANYIGFFEGDTLANDDVQFKRGVDQQIMKNGLRVSIPIVKKSWLLEVYGVHTQSFQTASVPSYATIGVEIGRHFIMNVEGRPMDLGFFSLGFYSDIGNHYSSGHIKLGSGWRF